MITFRRPEAPRAVRAAGESMRPRVGVSRRLLDKAMRHKDGQGRYYLPADVLDPYVEWVPYSQEMETGLGTLLEISRLTGRSLPGRGTGRTPQPLARDLDGYLWKATSATDGVRAVSGLPGDSSPF